jgi:hypothetical protein
LTSATSSGVPVGHDIAPAIAAFRADIDDVIRHFDDVEVVLDHDHGIAMIDQDCKDGDQAFDVIAMKTGRRLIEDIDRLAGRPPLKFKASLIRWASPPERVVAGWPSLI